VSPVRYELGFYNPGDDILNSHRREDLKSYTIQLSHKSGEIQEQYILYSLFRGYISTCQTSPAPTER
jgi:hypothetical protein